MTDNKIDLIAIKDLVGMNFFIPSYQRGYRWKEIEINALLDDINEFNTERDGKFYCLQPLVVRKKDNRYRIIDGQQRLTTILLTLKALNDNDLKTEIIEYERDNYFSQLPFDYINEIQITANNKTQANSKYIEYIDDGNQDKDKIEFYYLFTNYLHIRKWLQENSHEQLADKIKNDTCFIWYNIEIINDDDEYDIFRNLNSGKIPLTNAELIKALFLRNIKNADYNNNKTNENERERELTQKIIAEEYDQIERRIRDLEFWYFLNPNKQQASSCINFIFDLMYQTDEKLSDDKRKEIESVGSNSTFYYFERKISYNSEGTRRNIEEQFNMSKSIWEDVQKYSELSTLILFTSVS